MYKFFITISQELGEETPSKERLAEYNAKFDVWNSMAYFVARELHIRPLDILTKWSCEELAVAYGEYANIHSAEAYETRMSMFRKNEKPRKPSPDEKWAVLFITRAELAQMHEKSKQQKDRPNLADLAQNFFR